MNVDSTYKCRVLLTKTYHVVVKRPNRLRLSNLRFGAERRELRVRREPWLGPVISEAARGLTVAVPLWVTA